MAIYIPGVKDYVPNLEVFTPDYKFLSDVLETRQDRYTTNYEQLNNLYGKVVYSDLSREDNQSKRDQYAQLLAPRLEQISGLDLSLQQNVDAAKSLFKPFWDDENIVYDMLWTKKFNEQQEFAQQLENSTDEATRERYWPGGVEALNFQMEDFIGATQQEARNMPAPKFTPDPDLFERAYEVLKESGMTLEDFTMENGFIISQKNGTLLTRQPYGYDKDGNIKYGNPARDYAQEKLQDDPLVKNYYATKAYVEMRRWVKQNEQQYGGINAAKEAWADQKLAEYNITQGNKISKTNDFLAKASVSASNWDEYKKTYGIIPKSNQEEEYFKAIARLETSQGTKQMQLTKMNHITSPSGNLDTKLMKAYSAIMGQDIGGALERASIKYSMIDASRTVEINPYEKMRTQHAYDLDKMAVKQNYDKILIGLRAQADAWKETQKNGNTTTGQTGVGIPTDNYTKITLSGAFTTGSEEGTFVDPDNPTDYDFARSNVKELVEQTEIIDQNKIRFVQNYIASTSKDPSQIKYEAGGKIKTGSPDEFAADMKANPEDLLRIHGEYDAEFKKVQDLKGDNPKLLEGEYNGQYNVLAKIQTEIENRITGWESSYDENSSWLKTSLDQEIAVDSVFNQTLGDYGAPSIITNKFVQARIMEGIAPKDARATSNNLGTSTYSEILPWELAAERNLDITKLSEKEIAFYEKETAKENKQGKARWVKQQSDLKYYVVNKEDYIELFVAAAKLTNKDLKNVEGRREELEHLRLPFDITSEWGTGREDYDHPELMLDGKTHADNISESNWQMKSFFPDWAGDRNIHGDFYSSEITTEGSDYYGKNYTGGSDPVSQPWKFNEEEAREAAAEAYDEQYKRYHDRWNSTVAGTPGGPETFTVHQYLTGEEQTGAGVAMYQGYEAHYDHIRDFGKDTKANYQWQQVQNILNGPEANYIVATGIENFSKLPEHDPYAKQALLQVGDATEAEWGKLQDKSGHPQFSISFHQAFAGSEGEYTINEETGETGNYSAYVIRLDGKFADQFKGKKKGIVNQLFDQGTLKDNTLIVYLKGELDNNVMRTENQPFSEVGQNIRMNNVYKNTVPHGGKIQIWEVDGQYWHQVWSAKFDDNGNYTNHVVVPAQRLGYRGQDGGTTLLTWGQLDAYANQQEKKMYEFKKINENLENNRKAELNLKP